MLRLSLRFHIWHLILWISFILWTQTGAFTPHPCFTRSPRWLPENIVHDNHQKVISFDPTLSLVSLEATGDGKKRKRRRKTQPPGARPDQVKTEQNKIEKLDETDELVDEIEEVSEEDLYQIQDVAKFQFDKDKETSMAFRQEEENTVASNDGAIPLPDIREARQKKEAEELARQEEERLKEKRRIKRSDKEAFTRLLEQQPYADADDSYFEEEKYSTVSALLAEGSKPFLGIPSGPLQVGHFVGSLGIILMAFIEYPGFPLTNLPTPLRDCLQGGLAMTYAINAVLAIVAAFKAGERGQPAFLWVLKTFSVGGLAYDQLTQLPTKEELKKAKSRS